MTSPRGWPKKVFSLLCTASAVLAGSVMEAVPWAGWSNYFMHYRLRIRDLAL